MKTQRHVRMLENPANIYLKQVSRCKKKLDEECYTYKLTQCDSCIAKRRVHRHTTEESKQKLCRTLENGVNNIQTFT